MNMMLDFGPLNNHFSDYRNMATKATYYGRDVINEAGAWLRKCFAAEARVVRVTVFFLTFLDRPPARPLHEKHPRG